MGAPHGVAVERKAGLSEPCASPGQLFERQPYRRGKATPPTSAQKASAKMRDSEPPPSHMEVLRARVNGSTGTRGRWIGECAVRASGSLKTKNCLMQRTITCVVNGVDGYTFTVEASIM